MEILFDFNEISEKSTYLDALLIDPLPSSFLRQPSYLVDVIPAPVYLS